MGKRVLVCGGRDFKDYDLVCKVLEEWDIDVLIQGGAKGADSLAGEYAESRGIHYDIYRADWQQYGKGAGYRRNAEMLKEGKPDLVIAFEGGKGTTMMVGLARKAGVSTLVVGGWLDD